jgi:hypothetical protein
MAGMDLYIKARRRSGQSGNLALFSGEKARLSGRLAWKATLPYKPRDFKRRSLAAFQDTSVQETPAAKNAEKDR